MNETIDFTGAFQTLPPSNTELALVETFNGPVIPLADVCERYFGLTYQEATRVAIKGKFPVPVFRLRASQKAPVVMHARDLAAHIDTAAQIAAAYEPPTDEAPNEEPTP